MEKTCTTIQGETWDEIAYRVYGAEKYASYLMEKNYRHLDILVFSAGTVLQTPDLPEESGASLPSWRTEARAAAGDPYSV
jgi:phage tail protein X